MVRETARLLAAERLRAPDDTLPGVCNFTARPRGATTMQTDAHNMGREERRALLEQRRAAVVRQLRRLAIELTDLDRQLDEIEQSAR